ncbi:MAG: sigma-70 family RNA polymerase sigma factor [Phycisphaeraceae bacterium]|nr:sigma-70 family RNA polymerase sigma factor [Phycisphaeraceae bacterium]
MAAATGRVEPTIEAGGRGPGGAGTGKWFMLNSLTTGFISRLRARDQAAWFDLWETFGPVLRAQLTKWGKGRIGPETVRDLSQETLAALSDSIDRYDPARGARFSTWLLAIAKHVLGDEMDRRSAQKRGGNKRAAELDESWMVASTAARADAEYEAAVFRAKVEAAIRLVEKSCDFTDFSIYRMRVLDGMPGKDVANSLGISEPTVSRRLAKVRDSLRSRLEEVIATYSFTEDERSEADRNGLALNPTKADDVLFDDAIADIYRRQVELREADRAKSRN